MNGSTKCPECGRDVFISFFSAAKVCDAATGFQHECQGKPKPPFVPPPDDEEKTQTKKKA